MDIQTAPVVVSKIKNGFKLVFNGPIHLNTAWLERELDQVVSAKPQSAELDLQATEYISSYGLGILIGFKNRIAEAEGTVKIIAIHPKALGLLRASRLDGVLGVEKDLMQSGGAKKST